MLPDEIFESITEKQKTILCQLAFVDDYFKLYFYHEWAKETHIKELLSYKSYSQELFFLVSLGIIQKEESHYESYFRIKKEWKKPILAWAYENKAVVSALLKGLSYFFSSDFYGDKTYRYALFIPAVKMAIQLEDKDALKLFFNNFDSVKLPIYEISSFTKLIAQSGCLHYLQTAGLNRLMDWYMYSFMLDLQSDIFELPENYDKQEVAFVQELKLVQEYIRSFAVGNFKQLIELKKHIPDSHGSLSILHAAFYIIGDEKSAKTVFKKIKNLQSQRLTAKENILDLGIGGMYQLLHTMKFGTPSAKVKYRKGISNMFTLSVAYAELIDFYSGESEIFYEIDEKYDFLGLSHLLGLSVCYWADAEIDEDSIAWCKKKFDEFHASGLLFFELQVADLLSKITDEQLYINQALQLKQQVGLPTIASFEQRKEKWQMKLDLLKDIGIKLSNKTVSAEERLVWLIDFKKEEIQPKVQKITKSGAWTAGRNASLANLKKGMVPCASKQDMSVTKAFYEHYWGGSMSVDYRRALPLLVGHPLLFQLSAAKVPIELVKKEVELIAEQKGKHYKLYFSHPIDPDDEDDADEIIVEKLSANKYQLVTAAEGMKEIFKLIGAEIKIPVEAKQQLLDAITPLLGNVPVRSSMIGEETGLEKLDANSSVFAHMLPIGNGIKVELLVQPLIAGPFFQPAQGNKKVLGEQNRKSVFCERDFKTEKEKLNTVLNRCEKLSETVDDESIAIFENPADCLSVLSELRKAADLVTVQWPKGEKLKIKSTLRMQNVQMSIKKENNWFDVSAQIKVDENEVLDLKKLLKLLEKRQGNFIEVGEGMYLELEKQLVKQLEFIDTFADTGAKKIKMHPLAMLGASEMFLDIDNLVSDDEWKAFLEKIEASKNKKYQLPKNLDAELRPYQTEGYRWLRKLADWGVGACLADDMGLGKTVQCIALMLSRLKDGPALIVAPSSVCRNWVSEILKFGPSLRPLIFHESERENTIKQASAYDVVITSYGLMQSEAELFASRTWNTIVLDEAHAIKNTATKRSKAAMELDAGFKIIATGTPLQNNMGELWNLFQFINPGLLGSQKSFLENVSGPIERNNDERLRKQLKQLIQPFILRRTKNQVLDELPEKTEITLAVELTTDEQVFYEAMREKAVEDLANLDSSNPGEKQMRVLAEITKLRMACCHPSLVMPETKLAGAKLAQFEEIVSNLLDNNHKALVFSQFVKHLDILRKSLDKKGISYEYLDGSTSLKEREKRIKNFQAGNADLFLISLKAGGVGLNLTAADYVIHMDPWWNPAIEDQASDRAHRIGQTRPVTIYRLVAKGTIEERIVQLHKNKRDLADSLLEGAEASTKITADDLIALLKNG